MFRGRVISVVLLCVLAVAVPAAVYGAGGHGGLDCTGCHGVHTSKGEIIFAVAPNTTVVNPRTNEPYKGVTALCLGCHETTENNGMGILPVSSNMSHPYGVSPSPKVANVPAIFLRDGKLSCVGCHDPHPSNPNYKYLRVDTADGGDMQKFCAICHASKADIELQKIQIFDSMDERRTSAAASPQPGTAAEGSEEKTE